eukprot:674867-Lingulodinium_polyedra.AAC.1
MFRDRIIRHRDVRWVGMVPLIDLEKRRPGCARCTSMGPAHGSSSIGRGLASTMCNRRGSQL